MSIIIREEFLSSYFGHDSPAGRYRQKCMKLGAATIRERVRKIISQIGKKKFVPGSRNFVNFSWMYIFV